MARHLLKDLDSLKKEIMCIASMVEEATTKAIRSFVDRRLDLAEEVIEGDFLIDQKEVKIEDECLKVLALHQPVAADLRFIITVIKVNNDLERIGDLAANIAGRALHLSRQDSLKVALDFPWMAQKVGEMLRRSLDALADRDTAEAFKVLTLDDDVDEANRTMFVKLQEEMHRDPSTIERAVHLLSISRHLERIGDLATNIAQDVIYMVEGELHRHNPEG